MLFGGDCHFGDKPVKLDSRLRARIGEAAFLVVNQESPITDIANPVLRKEVHLRSSPGAVDWLRGLGVKVASLANNHIADYGQEGLEETISRLKSAGIAPVGAGVNAAEANGAAYVDLPDGGVIAFLAFTSGSIESKIADERGYGCSELDPVAIERAIRRARQEARHVVLLLHFGLTNFNYPTPHDRDLLRSLARRGVDLIVGHHPHVVQGYEILNGVPIFYSLGNLIFASYRKRGRVVSPSVENRSGALVAVTFSSEGAQVQEVIFTAMTETDDSLLLGIPQPSAARARSFDARSGDLTHSSYEAFFRRYSVRRLAHRLLLWTSPRRWPTFSTAQLSSLWLTLAYVVGRRK